MSVNRYHPHVLVLPEDDANRQIANGFLLEASLRADKIQILPVAGGWNTLLERFKSDYDFSLQKYPHRYMVLLIDFDGKVNRLELVKARIPESLRNRVFVLGALNEPEYLRKAGLGSYEAIGMALAKDCCENTDTIWNHNLLKHNAVELARLRACIRHILFPTTE